MTQKKAMLCLGEESYTIERFESTIWGVLSDLCFLYENIKNSKLLRCEFGKMTSLRELFHFSTTQGYMLDNATYPTCMRNALESPLC
jgi:hypothetical protein